MKNRFITLVNDIDTVYSGEVKTEKSLRKRQFSIGKTKKNKCDQMSEVAVGEDEFVLDVLEFIFNERLKKSELNKELREMAAKLLWEATKASKTMDAIPRPPKGIPSLGWLVMEAVQIAFRVANNKCIYEAVRKTVKWKWKSAYRIAKMSTTQSLTENNGAKTNGSNGNYAYKQPAKVTSVPENPKSVGFILSGSVGKNGDNQPNDVFKVKQRLRGLGFHWIKEDQEVNSDTISTIKLFQSIVAGRETVGSEGKIDTIGENTPTYSWLQALNAPHWKQMPARAKGIVDSDKKETNVNDGKVLMNWGTNWLIDTILAAGADFEDNYRKGNSNIALIHTNDLSLERGGDTKDHAGHETGLMLDIRLPRLAGKVGGITWRNGQLYDRATARAIIQSFSKQPLFSKCLFNDEVLINEGLCAKAAKHDDHIHIKINPPLRR